VNTHTLVFPICSPGCPITQWETVIQDDVAEKVLDKETMSDWVPNLQTVLRSSLFTPFGHSMIGNYLTRSPGNTVRTQNVQRCCRPARTLVILKPDVRFASSGFVYPARWCGIRVSHAKMISPPPIANTEDPRHELREISILAFGRANPGRPARN